MTDLKDIFEQFKAEGTFSNAEPYGSGHIHDTFRVETREADTHNYILQRLNNTIFKDIEGLQNNISLVT
ncbi:MAG: aminoglycoside phosphotransferase, partial [Bacteroidales bacterium]|nr:aminoglycoside phosphotransferase [Bacteroidales bacterium]